MGYCKCGNELTTTRATCQNCHREYMRDYRNKKVAAGLSRQDVYNYSWRERNPKAYLLHNAKSRAKKKGWDFNITSEDIIIPDYCPVLGLELKMRSGKGTRDDKPSIDRIDSSKGYVRGNVRIISWRANNLLSDGNLSEFRKILTFLESQNAS